MKFEIPESFQVAGQVFKINKVERNGRWVGQCKYAQGEIDLSLTADDVPISSQCMEQSFFHEMVHAILQTAGETDKNDDEQFVDRFAQLLHQAIISMR